MSRRWAAVLTGALLLLAGCAQDLQFRKDERLRFLSPPPRSEVDGPVLVRWQTDAAGASGRQLFGVFVDRSPMRPGQGLKALAEEDAECYADSACPDARWLRRENVHLTKRHQLALPTLPVRGGRDLGPRRRHEITVVLLDRRGRRLGEAAWSLVLFTPSEGD